MTDHLRTLADLEANGFAVHDLTPEQQDLLCTLTAEEFALLTDIKNRLDDVGPDVMAHSEIAGAALF
jgi:hypothetical protein